MLRLWSPRATRGHVLAFLGGAADGLTEIEEALAWARDPRHPAVEAECLWHRAEALAAAGQAGEAIEAAEESGGIAARTGHAEWAAAANRGRGIACEAAGLSGRAEAAYRRSLEAAEGIGLFRAWAAARLGALLARQGPAGPGRAARPGRPGGRHAAHPPRGPVGACRAPRRPGRRRGLPRGRRDRTAPGTGRRLPDPGAASPRACRTLTSGMRWPASKPQGAPGITRTVSMCHAGGPDRA
ncbi:MAG TPA: hypothetical protein VFQ68_05845 [Streptosporangiaceae bacterium]|nr:hypothetical protein [Streptosporangiaceae bacterium]